MSGKRVYYFKNRNIYDGEWKNDDRNRKGVYYNKDGDRFEGNGKMIKKRKRNFLLYKKWKCKYS